MKRLMFVLSVLVVLSMMVGGPQATQAEDPAEGGVYYWIQLLKGHPVHQLTQAAFLTSCRELGLDCMVVGPDEPDIQKTIAAAEQVLAKGDAAGVSFWTGTPAYEDVIKKMEEAGIPVVAPHFKVDEGTWPANVVIVGTDPAVYAAEAAKAICTELDGKTGSVAVTQGSFNTTENLVAESFTATMADVCPDLKVLPPEEEGFDPPKAIAKAVALVQANPDMVAALSTTGGGPTTWAGAQQETGVDLVAIGMDYTRVNLDLVKDGEMYAVVGQPLWDESYEAAKLLKAMAAGEEVPYWTEMPAPVITAAEVDQYFSMLDEAEAMMKGEAPAEGGVYYWIQLLKGHPVHQLTQAAFLTSCRELGLDCMVVGPDEPDIQKTIAAAEQVLAKGDAAGVSFWTGTPAYEDVIKKMEEAGIPVVAPHFKVDEGTWPANVVIVGTDPAVYAAEAAKAICTELDGKTGSVAVTQGSFNTTENLVAESFTATMADVCPDLKVLPPEEEGFDPPKAIAKAVALVQANPDMVAALSTTGGGPTTWAGAQQETGVDLVAIGMDYTRVNLDLVKDGEMYAVVGQPLWDESYEAAKLLKAMAAGEEVPYWTEMPAPVITAAEVDQYFSMLDEAEAMMKE